MFPKNQILEGEVTCRFYRSFQKSGSGESLTNVQRRGIEYYSRTYIETFFLKRHVVLLLKSFKINSFTSKDLEISQNSCMWNIFVTGSEEGRDVFFGSMRNRSGIFLAQKRNTGVGSASKRNSRFHLSTEKETKRKKSKRNENEHWSCETKQKKKLA